MRANEVVLSSIVGQAKTLGYVHELARRARHRMPPECVDAAGHTEEDLVTDMVTSLWEVFQRAQAERPVGLAVTVLRRQASGYRRTAGRARQLKVATNAAGPGRWWNPEPGLDPDAQMVAREVLARLPQKLKVAGAPVNRNEQITRERMLAAALGGM